MSDTPMTDALLASHREENKDGGCDVKRAVRQVEEIIAHTRTLERALAGKTAECEALQQELNYFAVFGNESVAECDRLRESQREISVALGVPGCDAAEMLNVIDSIRKDAERHRWLRNQNWTQRGLFVVSAEQRDVVMVGTNCPSQELLDAAIDAARKEALNADSSPPR